MDPARRLPVLVALAGVLAGGCTPDLGAPPSLVQQNRLLAIRNEPAEAVKGQDVTFTALTVGPEGTQPGVLLGWAFCITPKPLSENNAVSIDCVNGPTASNMTPLEDIGLPAASATGKIPDEVCRLFGPETPQVAAGMPPLRPRDPDVTGGYYQPVRATWVLGGPGGGDLVDFALARVNCGLANAPLDAVSDYARRYQLNRNPKLLGVTGAIAGAAEAPLPADGQAPAAGELAGVAPGAALTVRAHVDGTAAECFPVFDLTRRALVDHTESLRVSWFATAGTFEHDRTGAAAPEDCTPSASDACTCACPCGSPPASACTCKPALGPGGGSIDNTWTASDAEGHALPAGTVVHLWAVLRDSRGGLDFAGYQITVGP